MSKLEELIAELCPDGVDFFTLNTICDIYDGTHTTPDYKEYGVKFVSVENIGNPFATTKYISEKDYKAYKIKPQIGDVLMTRIGSIGVCTVIDRDEPLAYYVSLALLRPHTGVLLSKFLKYIIESLHGRKELRKRTLVNAVPIKINKDDIGKILIPVPPLPIQQEIVRILDSFTELTAELTAELEARKKQYEYYHNRILSFDALTPMCPLNDVIFSLNTGLNPRQFFKLNTEDATNFYITIREIRNGNILPTDKTDRINDEALKLCNNRSNLEKGDVLFSGTGTIGETAVIMENPTNWNIKEGVYTIKPNPERIDSSFLRYLLMSKEIRDTYMKKVAGGTVKSIPMAELKKIKIPVPSMEKQKEIVFLLDHFNTLNNDITNGLPAEIAARQKQYEYYRDKLLTFKHKEEVSE